MPLDYFCYLMEYSCLKTIANNMPKLNPPQNYQTVQRDGKNMVCSPMKQRRNKRVRPVKIADCKRGEASIIVFQRTKFNWKSTIRQRLNAWRL